MPESLILIENDNIELEQNSNNSPVWELIKDLSYADIMLRSREEGAAYEAWYYEFFVEPYLNGEKPFWDDLITVERPENAPLTELDIQILNAGSFSIFESLNKDHNFWSWDRVLGFSEAYDMTRQRRCDKRWFCGYFRRGAACAVHR